MRPMYDHMVRLLVESCDIQPDHIQPDATFCELGMDSLFVAELIVVLERSIGVVLDEGPISPKRTLVEAAAILERQAAGKTIDSFASPSVFAVSH